MENLSLIKFTQAEQSALRGRSGEPLRSFAQTNETLDPLARLAIKDMAMGFDLYYNGSSTDVVLMELREPVIIAFGGLGPNR
jgi:hypothetical protein